MRNQRYQNDYDDWEDERRDNQSFSRNRKDNWRNSSVNYCPRCGEPIDIYRKSQYPQRRYNQSERSYTQSYQNRSSCSSVVVAIAVIIALVGILASCNVGSSSASSDLPTVQGMNIKYNNIASPEAESVVYQISEPISSIEGNVQEVNPPSQPTSRTYIVKPGDTVYRIAVEMLGDGSRWIEIEQLNNLGRLANGSVLIHPGQVLILPDQ